MSDWTGEGCGGCAGLGSHRRHCRHNPKYHPWLKFAEMAESIGDTIGPNDMGLANRAYQLGGAIRQRCITDALARDPEFQSLLKHVHSDHEV